jgi:hypothetical protein
MTMTAAYVMLMLLAPAMGAADLSGKWIMDGDVQGNAVSLACVVEQNAEGRISGKCQINGTDEAEIQGTAQDAGFKFAFSVQGYVLTYTGTLDSDAVSGDIEVAGVTGKFSGKRAP